MKKQSKYPAPSFLQYQEYPVSGNETNGRGEKVFRRPKYVFHSTPKTGPLNWDRMQRHFRYSIPLDLLPTVLRQMWATFRPQGPIADKRIDASDTKYITKMVKEKALELGAGVVGISHLKEEYLIEGAKAKYKCHYLWFADGQGHYADSAIRKSQ